MQSQVTIADTGRGLDAPKSGGVIPLELQHGDKPTWQRKPRFRWGKPLLFTTCVVLPTIAMMLYALTARSPLFTSEVSFAIRSKDGQGSMAGLGALAGRFGVGLASSNDIFAVRNHLESPSLFEKLDAETKLSASAARPERDWWVRLPTDATTEQKYRYFKSAVDVKLSTVEQIITISASTFSPDQARNMTATLVKYADAFVNEMSEKAKSDSVTFAESEMRKAEARVTRTRVDVTDWRNANLLLDPQKAVEAQQQIISGLMGELSKIRAEIVQLESSPTDVQARVRQSRMREKALVQQIERERQAIAGETSENAKRISEYERLTIERDLAEKAYATATDSLKAAQQDAIQKQKYIVITAEPSKPQEATFPRVFYHPALVAASGLGFYFIAVLLFSLLRDYRETPE
jgi:capsular polysaccharide transport system permease protein